ncbi:hypothetical protein C0Q70_10164 [Pomacea canaliculata]|uniref:G-protein coupled receptors family 1 profile domain-containing protein n=1 Tax=Pomacea canaliculata TaxID=400727 RepID=A0A2T7PBV2_POMCA|nr:hypothetical protein C0Q70_10164 [Pomacea canaliculata]
METRLDKTLLSGALFLIGLLVTAVNLLTIMVVLRTPQLRHSDQWQANMYVLSLAVADTLVGAALVWMACLFIPETRAFIDSSYALCTSGVIVCSVFVSVSHATLLVIALDRLCYIVYPFFYGRFFLLSGACYLRIACVVRNEQRRIRTILQVTANISSKENDLLYRDNHTTSKQKGVTPKASGGDHVSVKEVQENGHLEPQTVLSVQDRRQLWHHTSSRSKLPE